jgi:hypothetical protein
MTRPEVHIYTLSRLVNARVGGWERKIREIEQGRRKAYAYYQPMREAVIAYCAAKGKGRDRIVSRMLADARKQPHARGQDPEQDNLAAFEMFETACYPKIGSFVRSLLRYPQGTGTPFEGVLLHGAPSAFFALGWEAIVRMHMGDCILAQRGFMVAMSGSPTQVIQESCPEYTLVADDVVYVIVGKQSNQLIPLAETIDFRLHKNELAVRVDDAKHESKFTIREMVVRSEWERVQRHIEEKMRASEDHEAESAMRARN